MKYASLLYYFDPHTKKSFCITCYSYQVLCIINQTTTLLFILNSIKVRNRKEINVVENLSILSTNQYIEWILLVKRIVCLHPGWWKCLFPIVQFNIPKDNIVRIGDLNAQLCKLLAALHKKHGNNSP